MPNVDELMAATIPAGVVDEAPIAMVLKLVGAAMSAAPLLVDRNTTTPLAFVSDAYPAAKEPE